MEIRRSSLCDRKWLLVGLALLVFVWAGSPANASLVFPGDLDGDYDVDFNDLQYLTDEWLDANCGNVSIAALDNDCDVDFNDFAILGADWGDGASNLSGGIYYVATDGNDSDAGTWAAPWATIQKAADTMVAGDKVIVLAGTYYEQVTPANSGDYWGCGYGRSVITYQADPGGGVIVDANGASYGFDVNEIQWIVIDGFKVTGASSDGIRFRGGLDSYSVVRNCELYNNGDEGFEIYATHRVTVENCLAYGNTGTGIQAARTSNNFEAKNCISYGNDIGFSLTGSGTIYDCVAYDNDIGFELSGTGDFYDCIVTDNTTYGFEGSVLHTVNYCDVYNNGTNYFGGVVAGPNCISSDPCFVNPPTDFHLEGSSPCIAAASDGGDMGYNAFPPFADAGVDQTVYVNSGVVLDGSGSKGNLVSYDWDFNDTNTGSGSFVTHSYSSPGTYEVTLTVDNGSDTDDDTCIVEVLPPKPAETVYHVTNLSDAASPAVGSFRYYLNIANGNGVPTRIVFDVNGVIDMVSGISVTGANTTICGTEAPGDGIIFDFGGYSGSSGFTVGFSADNCRFCNIHIRDTSIGSGGGTDGLQINSDNNVVERCTFTKCRDEGVSVMYGYGNVVAHSLMENCGSQPEDPPPLDDGRGLSVWYGGRAAVAGNCIKDNLRGIVCGQYVTGSFADFRNNLVTGNSNYGFNISSTETYGNFINNTIINNSVGIKYKDGSTFYRSGNVFSGNSGGDETYEGTYTEVFEPITRSDTPFPSWLEGVPTPTAAGEVGMGTGDCQCIICD